MSEIKVLKGKDGWLFLQNDSNKIIDQITNKISYDKYHAFRFRINHQLRHGFLKEHKIKYFSFIIPNKEIVYAKYLPDGIIVSEERMTRRLEKEMQEYNLDYFNYILTPLLESEDKIFHTYRKGDTHWNQYGAFIFYKNLMNIINKQNNNLFVLSFDDIEFQKKNVKGDLISKLSGEVLDEDIIGMVKKASVELIYNNQVHNTGSLKIYENKKHLNYPKVVVFRDSFTTWMEHFIAESFSQTVFVHQANLDYKLIEKFSPDFVISIQIERFAIGVPCDVLGALQSQNEAKKRNQ